MVVITTACVGKENPRTRRGGRLSEGGSCQFGTYLPLFMGA